MSTLQFRNVDGDPSQPVETWPLEALQAALERGDLAHYRRVVAAITSEPWGQVARRVEQVLSWSHPYGVAPLMHRAIERARSGAEQIERESVTADLHSALRASALPRAEFARRLGTSTSRLSTYLTGSVVPAATLLVRARGVAERARSSRS